LYIDATGKPITNASIAPKPSSVEQLINVSSVPSFNVTGAQTTLCVCKAARQVEGQWHPVGGINQLISQLAARAFQKSVTPHRPLEMATKTNQGPSRTGIDFPNFKD